MLIKLQLAAGASNSATGPSGSNLVYAYKVTVGRKLRNKWGDKTQEKSVLKSRLFTSLYDEFKIFLGQFWLH